MKISTLNIATTLFLSLTAASSFAQNDCNLYPYSDGIVYDNNGHDLAGFAKKNKKDAAYKSARMDEFSNGAWGYVQAGNARVPSVKIVRDGREKKAVLDHSQYIDATVALFGVKDGVEGTWWARQCNNPNGPLYYKKVDDQGNVDVTVVRYGELSRALETKKFTLVELNDSIYNHRDYDQLLKNDILVENGLVKDFTDYKEIIPFFNNFLGKFTYVDDPLIEKRSFLTFFTVKGVRYVAIFNLVNGKLAGRLELADFQYEQDKDPFVEHLIRQAKNKTVYIYGDDIFGLEKAFLKYRHNHHDYTFLRRKTDMAEKFNTEHNPK